MPVGPPPPNAGSISILDPSTMGDTLTFLGAALALNVVFQFAYFTLHQIGSVGWQRSFLGQLVNRRRKNIQIQAQNCREKTGYIGALLARYTAIITIALLLFNIAMNFAAIAKGNALSLIDISILSMSLYAIAMTCALCVFYLVFRIIAVCSEVIRQSEGGK
jgi:hypothetical protein